MKILGMESLEPGDICVVEEVKISLFSRKVKIKIKRLKSEKEIDEMIQYAHENMENSYWRGVKHALFWAMGIIEDTLLGDD